MNDNQDPALPADSNDCDSTDEKKSELDAPMTDMNAEERSDSQDSVETYALAKPEPRFQSAKKRRSTASPKRRGHTCPICGQSYAISTEGCPLCGWGEARRRGQSTQPTSWFSILAAGLNRGVVSNSAAAMVTLWIEFSIVLAVAVAGVFFTRSGVGFLQLLFLLADFTGLIYFIRGFFKR
ncbi:MAG: hypothetical protein O3A00_13070 [Planctomycetota bacterium]|nr:hypothetical protein [Planctomycetota bacterium]